MQSFKEEGSPTALVAMIQGLLAAHGLEDVRAATAHGAKLISRYDSLTLYEVDHSSALEAAFSSGATLGIGAMALEERLCSKAGKTGRTASTLDRFPDERDQSLADDYAQDFGLCLVRPMQAYGEFIGLLALHYGGRNVLPDADFDALRRFTDCAAVALANARTRDELRNFAYSDPLTGLANRRWLELEFTRLRENRVSMLLIDFDGLKAVNDTLGYDRGDALITAVADKLAGAVSSSEFVVRLGGDEFVVLMPHADPRVARQRAEELMGMLDELALPDDLAVLFHGASVGSAAAEHGDDPWRVLNRAGAEMRSRKRRRKDDRELSNPEASAQAEA